MASRQGGRAASRRPGARGRAPSGVARPITGREAAAKLQLLRNIGSLDERPQRCGDLVRGRTARWLITSAGRSTSRCRLVISIAQRRSLRQERRSHAPRRGEGRACRSHPPCRWHGRQGSYRGSCRCPPGWPRSIGPSICRDRPRPRPATARRRRIRASPAELSGREDAATATRRSPA